MDNIVVENIVMPQGTKGEAIRIYTIKSIFYIIVNVGIKQKSFG